jgi:hypothetical protein
MGPIVSPYYFERICKAPQTEKEMFKQKHNLDLEKSPEQLTREVRSGLLLDRYPNKKVI